MAYTHGIIQMDDRFRVRPVFYFSGLALSGAHVSTDGCGGGIMTLQIDDLAEALLLGMAMPEKLPEAAVSLSEWLAQDPEPNWKDVSDQVPPPFCPHRQNEASSGLPCRSFSPVPGLSVSDEAYCAVCASFEGRQLRWHRVLELVMHCRALGEVVDRPVSQGQDSHVAAIILQPTGVILNCDSRTRSYLKAGDVLSLAHGQLSCAEPKFQPALSAALMAVADSGRTRNILVHKKAQPEQRYSLSLMLMGRRLASGRIGVSAPESKILCLLAPLDGRRIATARQLMDLFGLSAAEARLARAICHDRSVEDYAREHGLGHSTVRTQLSAVFHKTGTRRQASLVRLIASIPVIRELC